MVETGLANVAHDAGNRPPVGLLANRILVARTWRTLMEQQRAAWAVAARKEKMKPYPFWLKINCTLLAYGQPLVMDPPKREKIKPNPVGKLEMLNQGGATARDVLSLARHIRRTVYEKTGVAIALEPELVGFTPAELTEYGSLV